MPRSSEYPSVRPYSAGLAVAGVGIVTLGLLTAPPMTQVAAPHLERHLVQLAGATAADASADVVRIVSALAAAPQPVDVAVRPAASSQTPVRPAAASTASDTSTSPPDLLALAAQFLDYLNSLGLGPLPGLLAIGLGGIAVTLGAVAYAWNGFAGLVNPVLDFLHIPKVPTFPVCFVGQSCGSAAAAAQARPATAEATVTDSGDTAIAPAPRSVGRSNRGSAEATTSARTSPTVAAARPAASHDRSTEQSTTSARAEKSAPSAATGSSKRGKKTSAD